MVSKVMILIISFCTRGYGSWITLILDSNLTEKERQVKNRQKLNELNAVSKGVRFNPNEHSKKIYEFNEQDYFRLFFKKETSLFLGIRQK